MHELFQCKFKPIIATNTLIYKWVCYIALLIVYNCEWTVNIVLHRNVVQMLIISLRFQSQVRGQRTDDTNRNQHFRLWTVPQICRPADVWDLRIPVALTDEDCRAVTHVAVLAFKQGEKF